MFTDRQLHGGSALSRTGLLFRDDRSRDDRILGVNRAPYGGICFLLKHSFTLIFAVLKFLYVEIRPIGVLWRTTVLRTDCKVKVSTYVKILAQLAELFI